jgi:hypothetical protein
MILSTKSPTYQKQPAIPVEELCRILEDMSSEVFGLFLLPYKIMLAIILAGYPGILLVQTWLIT